MGLVSYLGMYLVSDLEGLGSRYENNLNAGESKSLVSYCQLAWRFGDGGTNAADAANISTLLALVIRLMVIENTMLKMHTRPSLRGMLLAKYRATTEMIGTTVDTTEPRVCTTTRILASEYW